VNPATSRALIEVPIALRWRDLDAFKHVNNSTFLTYLEEARLTWFARIDGPWFAENYVPVVAATTVNYRAQLAWPGQIVVGLSCARLGNSSLTLEHRMIDAANLEKVYSDGSVVLVWIDPANGKPVPLPDAVRRACQ
jgi:acyl-CoA thioester hydrolase